MHGRMEQADWRRIEHPELDRLTSQLFSRVCAPAAALHARKRKRFGLDVRNTIDVVQAQDSVWRFFDQIGRLYDVRLPELYANPEQPGWLLLANCIDDEGGLVPALVAGASCLAGAGASALTFIVGHKLAALRPEWYLALALADASLEAVFWAAVGLVRPDAAMPKKHRAASYATATRMRPHVPSTHLEPLAEVVARIYARGYEPDLRAWRSAVVATCDRAGVLAAGDLDGARTVVSAVATPAAAETRLRQLEVFSASLDYTELREKLGLDPPGS